MFFERLNVGKEYGWIQLLPAISIWPGGRVTVWLGNGCSELFTGVFLCHGKCLENTLLGSFRGYSSSTLHSLLSDGPPIGTPWSSLFLSLLRLFRRNSGS